MGFATGIRAGTGGPGRFHQRATVSRQTEALLRPGRDLMTDPSHSASSSLREFLAVLRFRKWSIILSVVATFAAAMAFSYWQTPIYVSDAKVLVKPVALSPTEPQAGVEPNLSTEVELARSVAVAALAAQDVGFEGRLDDLLEPLDVRAAPETEILVFEYAHPSAAEAQRRTQAFADAYLEFRRDQVVEDLLAASEGVQREIDGLNEQLQSVNRELSRKGVDDATEQVLQGQASSLAAQVAILQQTLTNLSPPENLRLGQVVEPASFRLEPAYPNYYLNGAIALLGGLTLGIGLALLRDRLDESIRSRGDLEFYAGASVVAVIPRVTKWKKRDPAANALVTVNDPHSAASEAYRSLRTNVLFAASVHDIQALLVTSAHPGEGKTVTTANLGLSLARAGKRVVLVSADLRKPRLNKLFGYPDEPGLTNVLAGEVTLSEALRWPDIENLRLLPSGTVPANPAELLSSRGLERLLVELRQAADLVLVDSAPVLAVPDPVAMAPLVDGVLLVVDATTARQSALVDAREQLDKVSARVIGAVFNNVDASRTRDAHAYYGQYYGLPQKAGDGQAPSERPARLK